MQIGAEARYWVYILSNPGRTVLYVGVTNELSKRVWEHRHGPAALHKFTHRYHVTDLVYYEEYGSVAYAIAREKQIKSWSRARKDALIKSVNPEQTDLSVDWTD